MANQDNTMVILNGWAIIRNEHVSSYNEIVANKNHIVVFPKGGVIIRNEHVSSQNEIVANENHIIDFPNGSVTIRNRHISDQNDTTSNRNEHPIIGNRKVSGHYGILPVNNKTPAMCRGFPMTPNDTVPV